MNTAETLKQLGGSKFVAMTGATCYDDNGTLVVKFKGSNVANILYVKLNDLDLYDLDFAKYRGMNVKTTHQFRNVYSDMLQSVFTKTTGLYTRL